MLSTMSSILVLFCVTGILAFPRQLPLESPGMHRHVRRGSGNPDHALPQQLDNLQQAYSLSDGLFPGQSSDTAPSESGCCSITKFLSTSTISSEIPAARTSEVTHISQQNGVHVRQLANPLAGLASGLAQVLGPAFTAAMAPVQSAANMNLSGVSLVKSEAPSVIPTADVISPAQAAAAPVLSALLGSIVSAAQPLLNGAGSVISNAAEPVASLANPLQSAILPQVESAVGPLVSAIAPAVVAALEPAVAQLSSPLGPIESGLVAPLESAVAPLLSDVVGNAISALTGIEAPVASLLQPVLGAVDSAVLPLVTSVVSAVWPAIGPAITPLNPVICALQPAEVPVGGDATGLIPVQCVSITSGQIVPVSTGVATRSSSPSLAAQSTSALPSNPSAAATTLPAIQGTPTSVSLPTSIFSPGQSGTASPPLLTAPLQSVSSVSAAQNGSSSKSASSLTATVPSSAGVTASSAAAVSDGALNSLVPSSGLLTSILNSVAESMRSTESKAVSGISALSAVIPHDITVGGNAPSNAGHTLMTCIMAGATQSLPTAVEPVTGAQAPPLGVSPFQPPAASPTPSSLATATRLNPDASQASASDSSVSGENNAPNVPVPSPVQGSVPNASPMITPGPTSSQAAVILLTYGSQTVSFPAVMLPGGGMVASFMGSVFALPASASSQGLARRMEPISVGSTFDFDAFVHELSSRLLDKLSLLGVHPSLQDTAPVSASSSKGPDHQMSVGPLAKAQVVSSQAVQANPVSASEGSNSDAEHSGGAEGTASGNLPYPDAPGTQFTSRLGSNFSIVSDTNWIGRDIEFLISSSFTRCVDACDQLNEGTSHMPCAAALFVEDAPGGAANCYLKSSTDNPSAFIGDFTVRAAVLMPRTNTPKGASKLLPSSLSTATVGVEHEESKKQHLTPSTYGPGAINTTTSGLNATQTSIVPSSGNTIQLGPIPGFGGFNTTVSSAAPRTLATTFPPTSSVSFTSTSSLVAVFATGSSVITPLISTTLKLGVATNQPVSQYLSISVAPAPSSSALSKRQDVNGIPESILNGTGADFALADDPIDPDTGIAYPDSSLGFSFVNLTSALHLSRGGGKGGMVNGQHVFTFADTAVYTTESDGSNGQYVNYASSSVAVDSGLHALYGNPLILQDNPAEFATVAGAIRGFAPLTEGEKGFNDIAAQAGANTRYSVWPESSLIPLNSSAGISVAPIVYSTTDALTGAGKFVYAGNTLLTVTVDNIAGPVAERTAGRLFNASEVEWGNVGGLRSWGPSGVGGNDGSIYLFGNVRGGLLLSRTQPGDIANVSSYQYWSGQQWTPTPLGPDSTSYVLEGSFMDADVFYSPRHLTFVAVYTSIYGDSTVYWRYLKAPQALRPCWTAGGDAASDVAEALTRYPWSDEEVLFQTGTGLNGGYSYAAGVHLGYFGQDDIASGGDKMLLTWTSPTGQDPASQNSAFQLGTGVVTWA